MWPSIHYTLTKIRSHAFLQPLFIYNYVELENKNKVIIIIGTSLVEHLWCVLRDKLLNLLDQFVPFKMIGANCKQPWVNRAIIQLGRRKQRCYNHAKTDKQW